MKCHDLDSNSVVSAYVRVNNVICPEFNVTNSGKTIQCWISAETGQTIVPSCVLRTSVSHYQMELIVDGVLRDTRTVKRSYENLRHEVFNKAYFQDNTVILRGTMKAASLPPTYYGKGMIPEAVGTLEIRLYRSERDSDVHKINSTSFFDVESWRDLTSMKDTCNSLRTHEIQLAALDLNPRMHSLTPRRFVHGRRIEPHVRNRLKTALQEERLGNGPWLSFKFFYRSHYAITHANPELPISIPAVIELPRSNPITLLHTITLASSSSSSAVAEEDSKYKRNDEENNDRILGIGKGSDETEEPRMDSDQLPVPADYEVIKQRCSISTAVVRSISSTPPRDSLTGDATAMAPTTMPALPGHAASSNEVRQADPFQPLDTASRAEEPQHLEQRAKSDATKYYGSSTPEKHDVGVGPNVGNHENSTPKRRKKDVDQLRAKVTEARRIMEEGKRHADELRRKAEERQRQLDEEWDELQHLHREYMAAIEENQRRAEVASKELEDFERASN